MQRPERATARPGGGDERASVVMTPSVETWSDGQAAAKEAAVEETEASSKPA